MLKSVMRGLFSVIKRFFVALLSTLGVATLFGYILERMEALVNNGLYETLGGGTILFTAIIGTPIHEISHWLGCKIFGFQVIDVDLLRPVAYKQDGVLGYVQYAMDKSNIWQRLGCFFVGVAPMIFGGLFILLIIKLLKPEISLNIKEKVSKVSSNGKKPNLFAVGAAAFCGFWKGLFSLKKWGWLRGIICLYLVMSISMHMTISDADIEGAKTGIWIVLAAYGVFALVTAMIGCDYIIPGAKTAAFLSAFFSIGLLADALLLAIALLFSGSTKGAGGGINFEIFNTINLNRYVEVSCEGYDHYGTVSVEFDSESFFKRYGKKIEKIAKNEQSEMTGANALQTDIELTMATMLVATATPLSPDKTDRLSNGDVVNISWNTAYGYWPTVFSILEKEANLRFKYKDFSYNVKGLKVTDTFDPFTDVSTEVEGISGQAKFTFKTISTETKYDISFSPKQVQNLKNGDKVTVEVSIEDVEEYMKSHTALPYPNEKTYEISGLDYYAMSTSEIGRAVLNKIDSLAVEAALSSSDDWIEECRIDTAECIGNLFFADGKNYFSQNKYVSLIEIHAIGDFDEKIELNYYYPVEYTGFLMSRGSCEYEESYDRICRNRFEKDGLFKGNEGREYSRLTFRGYLTIDELMDYYNQRDKKNYSVMEKNLAVE